MTPPRAVGALALAAPAVAAARFFLKGVLDPLGVPVWLGSLAASLWVLLGIALFATFGHQGRTPGGRWRRAALPFLGLALWCELLVIAGILLTAATGADTYYEGPFAAVTERFPTAREHALGHAAGFLPRAAFWLLLGTIVYAAVRRRRRRATAAGA